MVRPILCPSFRNALLLYLLLLSLSLLLILLATTSSRKLPIISSMGAANKLDPTRLAVADLADTTKCRLARIIRRELRKRGIERDVKVVYSTEEFRPLNGASGRASGPGAFDQSNRHAECTDCHESADLKTVHSNNCSTCHGGTSRGNSPGTVLSRTLAPRRINGQTVTIPKGLIHTLIFINSLDVEKARYEFISMAKKLGPQ